MKPTITEKNRVLVYGTLRLDRGLPDLLRGSLVVEKSKRVQGYRMYSCGEYPTIVPTQQGGFSIEGDIIEVNSKKLEEIDAYEDVDKGEYERIWDERYNFWIYIQGKSPKPTFFPIDIGVWK